MAKPQTRTLSEFLRAEILRLLDEMTGPNGQASYQIVAEGETSFMVRVYGPDEVVTVTIGSRRSVSSPEGSPDAG